MQNNKQIFIRELNRAMPGLKLLANEPMAKHTTFKIGGPADYLVLPESAEQVAIIVQACNDFGMPMTILGNGSNVLVLDKGIRGMVIKMGSEMNWIRSQGTKITAGAGAILNSVARHAAAQQLTGLEFAVGIPGSIGGAVFMNAGAYDGEMSNVVNSVTTIFADGSIKRFYREEMNFSYRHSIFQENHSIICDVELQLQPGDRNAIETKINDYTIRRKTKQPLEMPSAGSTFKRPPGFFAGTLIEQAGLKGLRIGGAQVSEKHAGFIINTGGATARDVLELIQQVIARVSQSFGVTLQPEVRIIGEQ